MENRNCPSCGASAKGDECEYCGTAIPVKPKIVPPIVVSNVPNSGGIVPSNSGSAPSSDAQPSHYPAKYQYPSGYQPKDKTTTLILAIFLGWIGAHRFFVGRTGTGILMIVVVLFSFGIGWIWTLVDIIMIATDKFPDSNGYPLL